MTVSNSPPVTVSEPVVSLTPEIQKSIRESSLNKEQTKELLDLVNLGKISIKNSFVIVRTDSGNIVNFPTKTGRDKYLFKSMRDAELALYKFIIGHKLFDYTSSRYLKRNLCRKFIEENFFAFMSVNDLYKEKPILPPVIEIRKEFHPIDDMNKERLKAAQEKLANIVNYLGLTLNLSEEEINKIAVGQKDA